MNILITGGAGYIGSHTVVELLNTQYRVFILDNFCNSTPKSLEAVNKITNKDITLIKGDIRDRACLDKIFTQHRIDAVIHFAGLKAVGESVQKPLEYYDNNVSGSITLLEAMRDASVFKLVFSSSATVYGSPAEIPISESCPTGNPTNPYGMSKLMVERILEDTALSDNRWSIARLRYFNPIGAHPSGLIGENPNGIPNNLMPFITQVAVGKLKELAVFGDDYDTYDGTGVRDYIHVVDLAQGHLAALNYLDSHNGCFTWNLGTGQGYSVLDMIKAFEQVNGVAVPYKLAPRRAGDIAECWSNPTKAENELHWKAKYTLNDMVRDSWNWQQKNPNGFE
ncbi:UDP-galactose-4-epimerase [Pelistega indica]|uniref:UDP-glucose 4-epimerase n=1 Tax=Pelistega indica TaxID=1414851 RepID=V8G950_9BURK|nr:UDP-glucose 4-epimerase GalE [Pelistega indica]ETD72636.1 UDP-galactose-4-epimerase [Pelistega indica]